MAYVDIVGGFDLSVACSIIVLASTALGAAVQFGAGTTEILVIGLIVGLICEAFNGGLVTILGLLSIVVNFGTMSLFRGISYIIQRSSCRRLPPTLRQFRPRLCLAGVQV